MSLVHGSPVADKEEWLAARPTGIGASEVAAVLGMDCGKSPRMVQDLKLGRRKPQKPNERMEFGHIAEEWLSSWYSEKNRPIAAREVWYRPDGSILFATADGYADDRLVEFKTCDSKAHYFLQRDLHRDIPNRWYCQVQAQMVCSGFRKSDLVVMTDQRRETTRIVPIEFDPGLAMEILSETEAWWKRHIEDGEDCEFRDIDDLSSAPKTLSETRLQWEADSAPLIDEYQGLGETISKLTKRKDAIRVELANKMGDSPQAILPDGRIVKQAVVKRGSYTVNGSESVRLTVVDRR